MHERTLAGARVLVVEDEYLLADELRRELADLGCVVLGPVGSVDAALQLIEHEPHIDGAILDVNLGGDFVYPAADRLGERGVPFLFATGYDGIAVPAKYADTVRLGKPIDLSGIARLIGRAKR